MSTFKISELRELGHKATYFQKSALTILNESVKAQTTTRTYDIFLSHSFKDAELILGIKVKLEGYGHSVYVDWVEDPHLDRSSITPNTAATLRERMCCCRSLFYASTEASTDSKWMPWECGYFDGKLGRSAILPITETGIDAYRGREFLGIYPYVTEDTIQNSTKKILWVNRASDIYCRYDEWLNGKEPYKR